MFCSILIPLGLLTVVHHEIRKSQLIKEKEGAILDSALPPEMVQILLKLLPTSMSGLQGAQGLHLLAGDEADFRGNFLWDLSMCDQLPYLVACSSGHLNLDVVMPPSAWPYPKGNRAFTSDLHQHPQEEAAIQL